MDVKEKRVFADLQEKLLSYEYIRGLIEGEGTFTFHSGWKRANGRKSKIPAFSISMHIRDKELITKIRDGMGLKSKIYFRAPRENITNTKTKKEYTSERQAILVVRDFIQLKDIIIPFFHRKLRGFKRKQFEEWLERIGSDPDISDKYKSLYRLYKWGMYDTYPKFIEKFRE